MTSFTFLEEISTCCLIPDIDVPCRKPCSKPAVERILEFGRELYSMSQRLNIDKRTSDKNGKMLEVSLYFHLSRDDFHVNFNFRMHLVY